MPSARSRFLALAFEDARGAEQQRRADVLLGRRPRGPRRPGRSHPAMRFGVAAVLDGLLEVGGGLAVVGLLEELGDAQIDVVVGELGLVWRSGRGAARPRRSNTSSTARASTGRPDESLREQPSDERVDLLADPPARGGRAGRLGDGREVSEGDLERRLAVLGEQRLAGEHLEEERAERVDVALAVGDVAAHELGRHRLGAAVDGEDAGLVRGRAARAQRGRCRSRPARRGAGRPHLPWRAARSRS